MEHDYWAEKLQGYLDNELAPADQLAVQKHIEECPECEANLNYFQSMKRRLRSHAEFIEAPQSVLDRIEHMFEKKRKSAKRFWIPTAGIGLAAAAVLVIFVSLYVKPGNQFSQAVLEGQVVCHDCALAEQTGLQKGALCQDGHLLGLKAENGSLWRFACDTEGLKHVRNFALVGKTVRVEGETHKPSGMIRIKKLEAIVNQVASMGRVPF